MTLLTPEQKREIQKAGEEPIRIEDPETHTAYVILKADLYEKMRAMLEAEQIDPSLYEYGDFIPLKP